MTQQHRPMGQQQSLNPRVGSLPARSIRSSCCRAEKLAQPHPCVCTIPQPSLPPCLCSPSSLSPRPTPPTHNPRTGWQWRHTQMQAAELEARLGAASAAAVLATPLGLYTWGVCGGGVAPRDQKRQESARWDAAPGCSRCTQDRVWGVHVCVGRGEVSSGFLLLGSFVTGAGCPPQRGKDGHSCRAVSHHTSAQVHALLSLG